ncbi:HD-GYP domain-containing protein, partial [Aliivibrio fischeri]
SQYISNQLIILLKNSNKIQEFQFNKQQKNNSLIKEINNINKTLGSMDQTINDILRMILIIARSDNLFQLSTILDKKIQKIANSKSSLYIINNDILVSIEGEKEISIKRTDESYYHDNSKYYFNLHNDKDILIGCLVIDTQENKKLSKYQLLFIERLAQIVSISINKHNLLSQQKALFSAFTHSIASAIDAKSAHTGGHCQRVPELTLMFAKAAHKNNNLWKEFSLTEQEWEELYLAAWLHDCGKLTTADHVIDKATKL